MAELSEADLEEIESLAESDAGEHCRGPLPALVEEVRRLRASGCTPLALCYGEVARSGSPSINPPDSGAQAGLSPSMMSMQALCCRATMRLSANGRRSAWLH